MKNVIKIGLFLLWLIGPIASFGQSDSCINNWINEFEKVFLLDKSSINDTLNTNTCVKDTIEGINILINNVFYWDRVKFKMNLSNTPSYLYKSTSPLKKKSSIPSHISVKDTRSSAILMPQELIKIYYICSLYEGSFTFRSKVSLGLKNKKTVLGPNNNRTDRKMIKYAYKSLKKWNKILSDKGLDYVRDNNISPLFFSKLEWK